MAILVTGGLGFVGSHFVWAASRIGREVVVLDDGSAGTSPPMPEGVTTIRGDIGDKALVRDLLRRAGVDAIVHFAGKIQVGESVANPALYLDVNLVRALALLDCAREASVLRMVFSSTAAVYGEPEVVPIVEDAPKKPVNAYGASKLAFEYALEAYGKAYGLKWAALRYFNAAGAQEDGALREMHEPETHLIPLVIDAGLGRRPPLTLFGTDYPTRDGTCERDYIHVSDLVSAHLRAIELLEQGRDVGPLNLGTGRGSTVREVIEAASRILGKPVPFNVGARRAGDPSALVASPARAEQVLGWRAVRSDLPTLIEDALRSRR